ncbi:hypothetical protein [Microvirga brassicacearum]|uniref:Uncharacterized protein n=1 Tax=Microvirga brassicacearum TaxID=2580413 RepID=A0A5N3PDP7_9HYPH|nr:hypothetical protein [Microvirga brassicacearum]KAB0267834.1 hypothetical protein FEZ63_07415 [Microvirga brassicacearum]
MLHHITLHLARSREFPEGSTLHGYEITAPLDANGMLEPGEWASKRAHCRVRRFWPNAADRQGVLIHRQGGSGGATWMIDYNTDRPGDEEAGYRLNQHRFAPGEYVTIEDENEKPYTFEVVAVRAAEQTGSAKHS